MLRSLLAKAHRAAPPAFAAAARRAPKPPRVRAHGAPRGRILVSPLSTTSSAGPLGLSQEQWTKNVTYAVLAGGVVAAAYGYGQMSKSFKHSATVKEAIQTLQETEAVAAALGKPLTMNGLVTGDYKDDGTLREMSFPAEGPQGQAWVTLHMKDGGGGVAAMTVDVRQAGGEKEGEAARTGGEDTTSAVPAPTIKRILVLADATVDPKPFLQTASSPSSSQQQGESNSNATPSSSSATTALAARSSPPAKANASSSGAAAAGGRTNATEHPAVLAVNTVPVPVAAGEDRSSWTFRDIALTAVGGASVGIALAVAYTRFFKHSSGGSEIFRLASAYVEKDARVQKLFGGKPTIGNVQWPASKIKEDWASFTFSLSGDADGASGEATVQAVKQGGKWKYTEVAVVRRGHKRVVLTE